MKHLTATGKAALARIRAIDDHINRNFKYKKEEDLNALLKERAEKELIYKKELRK